MAVVFAFRRICTQIYNSRKLSLLQNNVFSNKNMQLIEPKLRCLNVGWLSTVSNANVQTSANKYCQSEGNEPDRLYKTLEIEVKGHDQAVMNSYEKFVSMAAKELDVNISKIWTPPKFIKRYTLLKSVHIYKKHRVQYEMRTYFRVIQLEHVTGSTADTLLEYIQRNLPEGMAMKVTRHAIEAIPKHIKPIPES